MNARSLAFIIAALDTIGLAIAIVPLFTSTSDPATRGLDDAAGLAVVLLYAVTVGPALFLLSYRRAPRTALTLTLVFPAVFAALFLAAVVAFL
jgi:hypothetical protein